MCEAGNESLTLTDLDSAQLADLTSIAEYNTESGYMAKSLLLNLTGQDYDFDCSITGVCDTSESRKAAPKNTQYGKRLTNGYYLDVPAPNPFVNQTVLRYHLDETAILTLTNLSGQNVLTSVLSANQFGECIINGEQLESGFYFYSVGSASGLLQRGKLIVTK